MKIDNVLVLLLVPLLFDVACGRSFSESSKGGIRNSCSYESCHATYDTKLNVHLIPHSHDDVGWLKTVDEYFYGANNSIQQAGVQFIIGSVVEALQDNADRKFIQVETAFFWQWWKKQPEEIRNIVKNLVNDGQLEIINAAWSMNDEAAAHYQSIIDQFTWGLRIIDDTLGECGRPNIGWQIDPFGHSSEMASIFSQLGYEAVFFARLDYRDKDRRIDDKALELIWQGSKSLGSSTNIFTHVFSSFYTQPDYFCWDVLCTDEPLVDDEESPDYNIERKVEDFANYVEKHAEYFQTNNLLVNMGGDFTYQAALMYYVNIDKLIAGFKKFKPNINVIYSTPSCYLKAVNEAAIRSNITFELKTDDFFPYTSNKHSAWTGYYTSRPNSKRLERSANNILQTIKQLLSFEILKGHDFSSDITLLKEAMGIMQHHDAITGTEKQHVAQDYARIVTKAINRAESNIKTIVNDLLQKENSTATEFDVKLCLLANVTHCEASNSEKFIAVVYNPLSIAVSDYIRLPTNNTAFNITGPSGKVVYQLTPVIASFSYVHEIQPSLYDLVFKAENVPPLGIKVYYVEASKAGSSTLEVRPTKTRATDTDYVGTSVAGFEINKETGLLQSVTLNGVTLNITQDFLYYNGMNGTNEDNDHTASGAYIFRPTKEDADQLSDQVTYTIVEGDIVDEVHQSFNSWVTQVIRVYKNENYIEFDWLVGPIEILDNLGTEIISRFTTDLKTNAEFYTDSNGRELLKRIRNYRETYSYTDDEPIAGNYYPVTARIVIKDEEKDIALAVLNDRAQGGSSIKDGAVELMVHRRLLNDDALGVGEALNEYEFDQPIVTRGQFILTFGKASDSAAVQKNLVHRKLVSPTIFVGKTTDDLKNLQENVNFEFSGIVEQLPQNVKILTLEPWKDNTLLLRLEHIFEEDEHSIYSQKTSVNLTKLFTLFDITQIEEMTLGANQLLSDVPEKLQWKTATRVGDRKYLTQPINSLDVDNLIVELNPIEIRTFIITYTARTEDEGGDGSNDNDDDQDDDDGDENKSSKNTAVLFFVFIAVLINYF